MPTPDHTLPPPLDIYWLARMASLRAEIYSTAIYVYGPSSAERLYELLYEFDVETRPEQKSSDDDGE